VDLDELAKPHNRPHLNALVQAVIDLIEGAGADCRRLVEVPLGLAAVEELTRGRLTEAAFQDVVRKLILMNPSLRLKQKPIAVQVSEAVAIALPPSSAG